MLSRWNDPHARRLAAQAGPDADLALRVYTSRLLGSEPALVLHGGGNTSVKLATGGDGDDGGLLYVKGSGSDLASVQETDFAAVRLADVRRLIELDHLDNAALAGAVAAMAVAPGPKPSIETLLHAVLPGRFVEHTHADSILAITNTAHGAAIAAELYGDLAPLVPFEHSGFALAKAAYDAFRCAATSRTIGLILLHHGVFAFGDSARESYENMLRLVSMAEDYLQRRDAWALPEDLRPFAPPDAAVVAGLRAAISRHAGFPLLMRRLEGPCWQAYARRADLPQLAAEGPATPQHAVFIKREPLLGTDADDYAQRYVRYVAAAYPGHKAGDLGLDPAPRVAIDPQLGVWAAGVNQHYLGMTIDILRQDMEIKSRAAGHDRYRGLPPAAILEAELHYGGFERRLHAAGSPDADFLGEVVVLSGAGVHVDALAHAFAGRGATVVRLDEIAEPSAGDTGSTVRTLALRYGGIDVLAVGHRMRDDARALLDLLACAPRGGRLLVASGIPERSEWARHAAAAHVTLLEADVSTSEGIERAVGACIARAARPVTAGNARGAR
jgi:rhamnose utilization protein RhaD (predicted bifunctional aldolase and dehydrogenase)